MKQIHAAAAASLAAFVAKSTPAAFISPTTSGGQLIGEVIAGTTYNVVADGTVEICGSCNAGGTLAFNPDGTVATTAQALMRRSTAGRRITTRRWPSSYGYYGAINDSAYGDNPGTPSSACGSGKFWNRPAGDDDCGVALVGAAMRHRNRKVSCADTLRLIDRQSRRILSPR